ncbi:MAG TPA: tetratricopeptide repeat protein [Burkholderiales bacterium]|nr:tetratricopeptide repeat protein [Burkholderiales bacterium]
MKIVELWDFADPAKSESRFRDAAATASGDWRLELQTQIARTYSLRKRYAEAHRLLDEIEPQLGAAGLKPRLRYLLERGRTFNSAGDKAAARPLFVQAWELGRAGGEEDLAIDAAHMVAIVEGGEKALDWNRQALAMAQSAHDPAARRWKASVLNNIGVELKELGRYPEALASFQQALAAYEERGDPRTIRIARWMVANTLRLMGRNDEALGMQLALERELKAGGEVDPYVLEELAALYEARGEPDKARPYAERLRTLEKGS